MITNEDCEKEDIRFIEAAVVIAVCKCSQPNDTVSSMVSLHMQSINPESLTDRGTNTKESGDFIITEEVALHHNSTFSVSYQGQSARKSHLPGQTYISSFVLLAYRWRTSCCRYSQASNHCHAVLCYKISHGAQVDAVKTSSYATSSNLQYERMNGASSGRNRTDSTVLL